MSQILELESMFKETRDAHVISFTCQTCGEPLRFTYDSTLAVVRAEKEAHTCEPTVLVSVHTHYCSDCDSDYPCSWSNCGGYSDLLCRGCAGQGD